MHKIFIMEKTEDIYKEWSVGIQRLNELQEEISSIQMNVDNRNNNQSEELSAELVDKIVQDSTDFKLKKENAKQLTYRVEEIETELIDRIKLSNTKSIRIPSNLANVTDNEIHINNKGKLESGEI